MPVLLATGYNAKAELGRGEFEVFHKPYDANQLVAALRAALTRRSAQGNGPDTPGER
jgi:hypothetical protein